MTGYEVATQIRLQSSRDLKIVAITGWMRNRNDVALGRAGFDGFLTKPVPITELGQFLQSTGNRRASEADPSTRRSAVTWLIGKSLLKTVCWNWTLDGVTLVPEKRKPFDMLAEGLFVSSSRGDCPSFEPLVTACAEAVLSPTAETIVATRVLRLSA